jgi:hypothetical protein
MADPQRTAFRVVVDYEVFGHGYTVMVKPVPIGVHYDRHFRWPAEAREYAERLSAATGWPISDLCDDEEAAA